MMIFIGLVGNPYFEKLDIVENKSLYSLLVLNIYTHDWVPFFLSFLSILSRSNFDHHLRCGGWLNFEFSKREKHSGWAIKTIYKNLCRGMLKHIPLYQ